MRPVERRLTLFFRELDWLISSSGQCLYQAQAIYMTPVLFCSSSASSSVLAMPVVSVSCPGLWKEYFHAHLFHLDSSCLPVWNTVRNLLFAPPVTSDGQILCSVALLLSNTVVSKMVQYLELHSANAHHQLLVKMWTNSTRLTTKKCNSANMLMPTQKKIYCTHSLLFYSQRCTKMEFKA